MGNMNISIKLKNRLVELEKLKQAVSKMSSSIDCTKRRFKELDLILEELFTNVVTYGFDDEKEHDIELSMSCNNNSLLIRMEDDGQPFDITKAPTPDTKCGLDKRCVGGLGIHLVKHFIDECKYYRKKGKNIVILKKYINNEELETQSDVK